MTALLEPLAAPTKRTSFPFVLVNQANLSTPSTTFATRLAPLPNIMISTHSVVSSARLSHLPATSQSMESQALLAAATTDSKMMDLAAASKYAARLSTMTTRQEVVLLVLRTLTCVLEASSLLALRDTLWTPPTTSATLAPLSNTTTPR